MDKQPTDDAPDPAQFGPGTFGCHEALHMANVCAEMVDERLCEHPAIIANPAWKALADRAAEALHDLYQAIGAVHLADDELPDATDSALMSWGGSLPPRLIRALLDARRGGWIADLSPQAMRDLGPGAWARLPGVGKSSARLIGEVLDEWERFEATRSRG